MTEVERPIQLSDNGILIKNAQEKKTKKRQRIMQLSMPKMSKAVWATIEPQMVWGNQEAMRPVSKSALKANASERLCALATPKKDFQLDHPEKYSRHYFMYSCGRPSIIMDVSPVALEATASQRVEELSKPKTLASGYTDNRPHYVLGCGRSSPIWDVSDDAKSAGDRPRTLQLAQPKATHREYQPARQVEWKVSDAAMNTSTPARIELLSKHKERKPGPFRYPDWVVGKGAKNAVASTRVQELSQPKKLTDGYRPNRDVEWRVPRSALRAFPTERLKVLSAPIVRDTMDHVQFDPLAFQVKDSALKGRVPARIHDLAQPVIRGPKTGK